MKLVVKDSTGTPIGVINSDGGAESIQDMDGNPLTVEELKKLALKGAHIDEAADD